MATRDATTSRHGSHVHDTGWHRFGHDETKLSLKTTEFWAMVAGIAAILIAAAVADNFDARLAWTLVAAVAIGYMVSRGLAKSGTRYHGDEDPTR